MIARLVECSDYDVVYGILEVENKSVKEVQETIYKIKNYLYSIGVEDWTIDDVFNEFPADWEWNFTATDYDDVVEI